MLSELHVKNLALIKEADLNFKDGLHVLTGETGAGKSLLLGSVGLALGGRADTDIVGHYGDFALSELTFFPQKEVKDALIGLDIDMEDDELILQRKISDGRGSCRINGETYPAFKLKQLAGLLIDIHGQHDNQSLLNKSAHRQLLDDFAGAELIGKLAELKIVYKEYSDLKEKLLGEEIDEREKEREIALLSHEINEIDSARLNPESDEEIDILFKKVTNSKKLLESVYNAGELIGQGASEAVARAAREISSVSEHDSNLNDLEALLCDIDALLSDAKRSISDYISDNSFSEAEYNEICNRHDLINTLKSKYGKTIAEILDYAEENRKKLEKYENYEAYIREQKKALDDVEKRLKVLSEDISVIRKNAANELSGAVEKELLDLNFNKVKFEVSIEVMEEYGPNGVDDIEFMISLNPGETVKPLKNVASGGELSRIMLALRSIGAKKDGIETLIFDEIDAGISGDTAQKVAIKLKKLSKTRQVICITHLPQIAAFADHHYMIKKVSDESSTETMISELSEDESVLELVRLLGGTKAAVENANELKMNAKKYFQNEND